MKTEMNEAQRILSRYKKHETIKIPRASRGVCEDYPIFAALRRWKDE